MNKFLEAFGDSKAKKLIIETIVNSYFERNAKYSYNSLQKLKQEIKEKTKEPKTFSHKDYEFPSISTINTSEVMSNIDRAFSTNSL
jgi:hypothetical protein